jgi:hypothetical protein
VETDTHQIQLQLHGRAHQLVGRGRVRTELDAELTEGVLVVINEKLIINLS